MSSLTGDPSGLAIGPDGTLWFKSNSNGTIGRATIDVGTGAATIVEFSDTSPPDLTGNTSEAYDGIKVGPDGKVWFTDSASDRIGRLDPATCVTGPPATCDIRMFPIGASGRKARNLVVGGTASAPIVWFTQSAQILAPSNVSKIGQFTASTSTANPDFITLTGALGLESVILGSDGRLWAAAANTGQIVRVAPGNANNPAVLFGTELAGSEPFGLASGPDGNVWVTQATADRVGKISDGSLVPSRVLFAAGTFTVTEPAGTTVDRTIQVLRTGNTTVPVSVNYSVANGTPPDAATSPLNFNAVSGTLNFLPGQTTATFPVTVKDDSISNAVNALHIALALASPVNAVFGLRPTATLDILANPLTFAPPTAGDDAATAFGAATLDIAVLANDTSVTLNATVDPATVDLDPDTAGQQSSFTVAGKGTFTVDSTGVVKFTADPGFVTAPADPVIARYTVADGAAPNSRSGPATISVEVVAPAAPTAVADFAKSAGVTRPVVVNVAQNDTAAAGAVIDSNSIDLDPATAGQQTTLTTSVGTWTTGPNPGEVTFTPGASFLGITSTTYTISDNYGTVSTASANISIDQPSGGGGCTIATRGATFDPTLLLLMLGASGWYYRRRTLGR